MPALETLQTAIHRVETGRGLRYIKYILLTLLIVLVCGVYDLRCYRNLSAPEAMDEAQLGRNIAQGHGFTTEFIRPLSVYLIRQKDAAPPKDPARLNSGHPDLANAPAYPVVLAGLMKVLPFRYDANLNGALWKARYEPDVLIALFNQGLFVVLIVLAFFWARWVFDERVAWTSVVLLIGTELLWRFSVSGLSTMMLLVIVMCLVWCLTLIEREAREPKWGPAMLAALSLVAGALAGLGGLTRYSFLWMIIPVALFLVLFGGPRRALLCVAALAAFAALMTPWLARNYAMSGHLFGVNSFAVIEGWLPNFRLQRSLSPDLGHPGGRPTCTALRAIDGRFGHYSVLHWKSNERKPAALILLKYAIDFFLGIALHKINTSIVSVKIFTGAPGGGRDWPLKGYPENPASGHGRAGDRKR